MCNSLGIRSLKYQYNADITQDSLLQLITSLNNDPLVDGILVQMPLPQHINTNIVINAIDPSKDVDGFHPYNTGLLASGDEGGFVPCTPKGCLKLLQHYYDADITGKNAVVMGRSNIVGKPMAALLLREHASVSIVHSRTPNPDYYIKNADIIVVAVGKAGTLKADAVKRGAFIIDVGINRLNNDNGKSLLVGDVDEAVYQKCGYYTPVPGGVGPMTIACLMENTVEAATSRLASSLA
jgi:methylenetetrahydrofolate dehydrogenase (NADP+)/methenyltetrahydrofolate cyclohydrolase